MPKKNQVEEISDFRPISLLSSGYKIVAKALATRLKVVMSKLVSDFQTAYIKGRQITDGILIASELVDSRLKTNNPGLVCKVDMEKAFDRLSWSYLDYILSRMGFGTKWRDWIKLCLTSASFSVLVNGTSCGFFKSSRGVRQGDPLSPLLFILAMEGISLMLQQATINNRLSGFSVKDSGMIISHLHYADDTILFLDANLTHLNLAISLLKCFEIISGLRVNLHKTQLIAIGEVPDLSTWAQQIGCNVGALPFKYLGIPLGANQKALQTWDPVIERLNSRICSWKNKFLSKGGRLTLLKSTLSNIPIYFLSIFRAPAKITKEIDKCIRNFLWSRGEDDDGCHLVNWITCCLPFQFGGLGIKDTTRMNIALLSKWGWRYGEEDNSLWKNLIKQKFGFTNSKWVPKITKQTQGRGCWMRILGALKNYLAQQSFKLQSGEDIRFWYEAWCEGIPLKDRFPTLFAAAERKQSTIADMIIVRDTQRDWNFRFRYHLSIVEENLLNDLQFLIGQSPPMLNQNHDKRYWIGDAKGIFSVKACYVFSAAYEETAYPRALVWNNKNPSRVNFYLWTATLNRCMTMDNMRKRGKIFINGCLFCKSAGESVSHLLLHCSFSWNIWCDLLPSHRFDWCMPRTVLELVNSWKAPTSWSARGKTLWKLIPLAACWELWLERNSRCFNSIVKSRDRILTKIKSDIYLWSKSSSCCIGLRFEDFVFNWDTLLM